MRIGVTATQKVVQRWLHHSQSPSRWLPLGPSTTLDDGRFEGVRLIVLGGSTTSTPT
jgi:hypothetical protein